MNEKIYINNKITDIGINGFVFEPIISTINRKIYGFEILSSFDRLIDKEAFFNSNMNNGNNDLLTLAMLQINIASHLIEKGINANFFINIPADLLLCDLSVEQLISCCTLSKKEHLINFEIQNIQSLIYKSVKEIRIINRSIGKISIAKCGIWLDDLTFLNMDAIYSIEEITGVKIDKEYFWRNMKNTKTLDHMIQHINIPTIIEGIENREHYNICRNLNVEFLQGYLWAGKNMKFI